MKPSQSYLLSIAIASLMSITAHAETRSVGQAVWDTNTPTYINTADVPVNMSQLIFVRFNDNLPSNTAANIAIDNRYHISLLPNHLSQVRVCTGEHVLSTQITANKSNDLTYNAQTINTASAQTYYYQIEVDDTGNTISTPLNKNITVDGQPLIDYISKLPTQAHQISRIVADCPDYVTKPNTSQVMVTPTPEPIKVELDRPINLEVLFEFDKAVVQPVYNQRIEAVADFMHKYPNTTTIIEGHTDSTGNASYNLDLSQRRADAVKQELVTNHGIAADRLDTQGYGQTRPVDTNDTAQGRHNNRRVEATVSAR